MGHPIHTLGFVTAKHGWEARGIVMRLASLRENGWMRFGIRLVALAACAIGIMFSPATAADDDEKGPLSEFYSYLPAAPDIRLPEFSIPFWTD